MIYEIVFSPRAEVQMLALHDYICNAASQFIAKRYTDSIVSYCESLNVFPLRGTSREDIRPGVRITHYKKRCVIAFRVSGDTVTILGVFYGGQDYESQLTDEIDE